MKKYIWLIPIILIVLLWVSGIAPQMIAKAAGTHYVSEHFPELELKCTGVEWSNVFGDYLISFDGKNDKTYSCVIYPMLFPVSLGQGLFAIESDYEEYKLIYGSVQGSTDDNVIIGDGETLN